MGFPEMTGISDSTRSEMRGAVGGTYMDLTPPLDSPLIVHGIQPRRHDHDVESLQFNKEKEIETGNMMQRTPTTQRLGDFGSLVAPGWEAVATTGQYLLNPSTYPRSSNYASSRYKPDHSVDFTTTVTSRREDVRTPGRRIRGRYSPGTEDVSFIGEAMRRNEETQYGNGGKYATNLLEDVQTSTPRQRDSTVIQRPTSLYAGGWEDKVTSAPYMLNIQSEPVYSTAENITTRKQRPKEFRTVHFSTNDMTDVMRHNNEELLCEQTHHEQSGLKASDDPMVKYITENTTGSLGKTRQHAPVYTNTLQAPQMFPYVNQTGLNNSQLTNSADVLYRGGNRKPLVMPETFDGSSVWQDYKVHFEMCANINGWNDQEKATYLAVRLRGPAQQLLGDMLPVNRHNYLGLSTTLEARFGSEGQTELFRVQLKSCQKKQGESYPELAQAIRRLVARAYPQATGALQEILSKDNFVDALTDSDMRLRIQQNKPTNLDEAVRMAIELDAFNQAERQRFSNINKRSVRIAQSMDLRETDMADWKREMEKMQKQMSDLRDHLEKMNIKQTSLHKEGMVLESSPEQAKGMIENKKKFVRNPSRNNSRGCWNCGEFGHIERNCRKKTSSEISEDQEPKEGPEN